MVLVTQKLNLIELLIAVINTSTGLITITSILENLISNVPAVLLIHPLIPKDDTQSWLLLAFSSTLAGNLTLIGAPLTLLTLGLVYWWVR